MKSCRTKPPDPVEPSPRRAMAGHLRVLAKSFSEGSRARSAWSISSSSGRSSPPRSPSSWCWPARSAIPAAGLAISGHHAAAGGGERALSGRQRAGRRRHRDDAARAADQRRPGHDLHVLRRVRNDGSSTITITFDVGYPLSIAAVDVQNRVSQAASSLPADRQSGRRHDQEAESRTSC